MHRTFKVKTKLDLTLDHRQLFLSACVLWEQALGAALLLIYTSIAYNGSTVSIRTATHSWAHYTFVYLYKTRQVHQWLLMRITGPCHFFLLFIIYYCCSCAPMPWMAKANGLLWRCVGGGKRLLPTTATYLCMWKPIKLARFTFFRNYRSFSCVLIKHKTENTQRTISFRRNVVITTKNIINII